MLSKGQHFVLTRVESRLSVYVYFLYIFSVCEVVIFVLVDVELLGVTYELQCRTFEIS
jgi:hypothetical protein